MSLFTHHEAQTSTQSTSLNFIHSITMSRVLLTTLIFMLTWIILKYIRLWITLNSYKELGGKVSFDFPFGAPARWKRDALKKGDPFFWEKETIRKNPNTRFIATHLGPKPVIYLVDPPLIKDFLTNQMRYKKSSIIDPLAIIGSQGLVFTNGELWKRHRRIISESFHFEFVSSQLPKIIAITNEILTLKSTENQGKNVIALEMAMMITARVVFEIFFGQHFLNTNIGGAAPITFMMKFVASIFQAIASPENLLFGANFIKKGILKRNREFLNEIASFSEYCKEAINMRRNELKEKGSDGHGRDFLGIMLQAQIDSKGGETSFSDEEILHEFATFFVAGSGTTARLISNAFYYYSIQSKEVQEQILEEARKIANEGDKVTRDQLNQTETMAALFMEVLRTLPPQPAIFLREALQPHGLQDVPIPKGMTVTYSVVTTNSNPKYYKNPEVFNLNRWIKGHPDFEDNSLEDFYTFLPFSGGPRKCIGKHLALTEAKLVFSILIAKYKFCITENFEPKRALRLSYEFANPLIMDLEKI